MNTLLRATFVLAFVMTSVASTSSAFAGGWAWDRDAGAKARGDFGPARGSDRCDGYTYRSRAAVCEFSGSLQRSCEPPLTRTPLREGSNAVVNVDAAKLMIGDQTVATITKGQQLTVLKIQGPWIGTSVWLGGQEKKGWIQESELVGLANQTEIRRCAFCLN